MTRRIRVTATWEYVPELADYNAKNFDEVIEIDKEDGKNYPLNEIFGEDYKLNFEVVDN